MFLGALGCLYGMPTMIMSIFLLAASSAIAGPACRAFNNWACTLYFSSDAIFSILDKISSPSELASSDSLFRGYLKGISEM
tara:strand:- start:146 stop:388 length:243 start_codon:yes stop_codon:yes gene_type:complete